MNLLLEGEQTSRLRFRKVNQTDFDNWLPFFQNPLSTRYWEGQKKTPRIACQEQFDTIFNRYDNNNGGMNALVHKTTQKLIGICGLLPQQVDGINELEIGYSILPNYWRKGYAFEAAEKCKYHAKQIKASKSLISIIHIDNMPSQKVALKNGMLLEKTTEYKLNPVHIFRIYI